MRLRSLFLLLVFAAITACKPAVELPILYPVPPTRLIADDGRQLSTESLAGQVAIYDFIFTRCGATCPMMTRAMQELTRKFPDDAPIRFVSVTVDPEHDTPEVLARYAETHRNDQRWMFLTGTREDVIDLSVKGFKLAAGDPVEGLEPFLHSTRFVLVDKEGNIRGYYDSIEKEAMAKLVDDAKALL
ncbi:MAG TPA: SCO family protein [Thermoanaerobaculia bacterium]|nr:SCO family protein [Thermoanaerobaculia bacterium]